MNANPHLTTDIDNTIDRALSALRDAAPRSGPDGENFAGRLLTSLEHRTTAPGGPPFHGLIVKGWGIVCGRGPRRAGSLGWGSKRASTFHLALWTASSAAVLAIASLLILHHHVAPEFAQTPQPSAGLASPGLAAGFSPLNTSTQGTGALAPAHPTHTLSSRPERAARSGETCISNHHNTACSTLNAEPQGSASTTPTDAQALADLHAPSHPAPPLPLTPQEKLFLRTLRYGNATQLAELSPIVRAKKDADETTDFKAFFPDPPPLHQPGDPE